MSLRRSLTQYGHAVFHFFGNAVTEADVLSGNRSHTLARDDEANQVQGISRRHGHHIAAHRQITHGAQRLDGVRQRELLAQKPADKATASDFAKA